MSSTRDVATDGAARLRTRRIVITALALSAAWAFDGFVLRTGLLTEIHDRPSWTPLYAVPELVLRPQALMFVVWSVLIVWLAPRTCDVERFPSRRFALLIGGASVMSSFTLFLVRQDPVALGALFDHYWNEEFLHDARLIVDPLRFLDVYVELMPQLSTHGRHFPPGHALLLYGMMQAFGGSVVIAGITSLAGVGAGCVCAYRAIEILCGDVRARQAAWLLATAPALLDFGAASMDAVFFAVAALALWLGLRALRDDAARVDILLAGCALFAATCFSFSAAMVGLLLAAYACFRARVVGRVALLQVLCVGVTWGIAGVVVWLATGFSILDCAYEAARSAGEFMVRTVQDSPNSDRARLFFGNAAAFAIMAGVGTISALTAALGARTTWRAAWTAAVLSTLAVMCALYYLETERIWLFALPWIAAIASSRTEWDAGSLRRLTAVNCAQALVMEAGLFTLW